MVDVSTIAGAVTSLKTASEMAKALVGIRDATILNQKVIELQGVILSAQSGALAAQSDQLSLLDTVRKLEKQIADLEAWETEKQRYELAQLAPGTVTYLVKESMRGAEPLHCICAACYEDGKKGILHMLKDHIGTVHIKCPRCKTEMHCWGEAEGFPIPLD